jgi:hypothetical protein
MLRIRQIRIVPGTLVLVAVLAVALLATSGEAQVPAQSTSASVSDHSKPGRVAFDFPGAPPATVEVDLSQGMLSDITGIGQAAIGGVIEGILSSGGQSSDAVQQSAEHLQAINQIVGSLSGVVHEVRIRIYDDLPADADGARTAMVAHYQQKMAGTDWDSVVRVREGDSNVSVCALRSDGAIRGIFAVVSEDNELIMVNVVCELTPEKIKEATSQATRIGMKLGLEKAIQEAMRELNRHDASAR